MTSVAKLVEEAMLLPREARTKLVEPILEHSEPSSEFIEEQLPTVLRRMENVREGRSALIPAKEAHRQVREALRAIQ